MNTEQNFLVRYGLHGFVSCALQNGERAFFIKCGESQSMICHAENLIKGAFGDIVNIQRA